MSRPRWTSEHALPLTYPDTMDTGVVLQMLTREGMEISRRERTDRMWDEVWRQILDRLPWEDDGEGWKP